MSCTVLRNLLHVLADIIINPIFTGEKSELRHLNPITQVCSEIETAFKLRSLVPETYASPLG